MNRTDLWRMSSPKRPESEAPGRLNFRFAAACGSGRIVKIRKPETPSAQECISPRGARRQVVTRRYALRWAVDGSLIVLLRRSRREKRTSILNPVKKARPNGTEVMLAISAVLDAVGTQNHPIMMPAIPPSAMRSTVGKNPEVGVRGFNKSRITNTDAPKSP